MSKTKPTRDIRAETIHFYDGYAETYQRNNAEVDLSDQYRRFEQHLPPGAHILDAGCGFGRDSLHFLRQGYQVSAFDASETMVRLAREQTGLPVRQLTYQELDFPPTFDGIWAFASLLHVPRAEMDEVIERLASALVENGVLFVSLKYADREEFRRGRWFNDYTETPFTELIARHPVFTLLDLRVAADTRPGRQQEQWLNALLRKQSPSRD